MGKIMNHKNQTKIFFNVDIPHVKKILLLRRMCFLCSESSKAFYQTDSSDVLMFIISL